MRESPDGNGSPTGSDAETKKENNFVSALLQIVLRTIKDQLMELQIDDAHGGTFNKNAAERNKLMHVVLHVCQALLHLQSESVV